MTALLLCGGLAYVALAIIALRMIGVFDVLRYLKAKRRPKNERYGIFSIHHI